MSFNREDMQAFEFGVFKRERDVMNALKEVLKRSLIEEKEVADYYNKKIERLRAEAQEQEGYEIYKRYFENTSIRIPSDQFIQLRNNYKSLYRIHTRLTSVETVLTQDISAILFDPSDLHDKICKLDEQIEKEIANSERKKEVLSTAPDVLFNFTDSLAKAGHLLQQSAQDLMSNGAQIGGLCVSGIIGIRDLWVSFRDKETAPRKTKMGASAFNI